MFYFDDLAGAEKIEATKISFQSKVDWKKFDVVHSHGLRPDLFVRIKKSKMPATVTTLHNYVSQDLKYTYNPAIATFFTPLWRWAWSKHKMRVVLSKDMEAYYLGFTKNLDFTVIPNTRVISSEIKKERLSVIEKFAKGRKVVGTLSTVNTRKGLGQIIEFIRLQKDWVYVHVGGGELNLLEGLAKKLNVQDRCLFLGHQQNGYEFVHAFDVFAMPSLSEGFPLSLIEAVQLKVPVVVSDIDVFKESFTEDEVTFFKLNDINSLNSAVLHACKMKGDLTEKAEARYKKDYSSQVILEKYVTCYNSILNG